MSPFIDEAHNLPSIISISDFQSFGLGENPRKGSEHNCSCFSYFSSVSLNPRFYFFLPPPNKSRPRKAVPLWMWFWPPWVSTTSFFTTLFPNRHPLSPFWPWNRTLTPSSMSWSSPLPNYNLCLSRFNPPYINHRPNLWMISRRPWMSRVDY